MNVLTGCYVSVSAFQTKKAVALIASINLDTKDGISFLLGHKAKLSLGFAYFTNVLKVGLRDITILAPKNSPQILCVITH